MLKNIPNFEKKAQILKEHKSQFNGKFAHLGLFSYLEMELKLVEKDVASNDVLVM